MENINPLEIQKLYNEQKEVLKQWEKKFQQEHQGQKPTKEEIIRYGMENEYKKYSELKKIQSQEYSPNLGNFSPLVASLLSSKKKESPLMDRILQKSSTPTKPKENLQKKLIKKNLFQERQLDPTELVENIHGDLMESESISDHSSEDESSDEERSKEDLAINFPKKSLVGPSSFMLSNKYRPCNSLKKFTIQNSQLSDKEEQETEESEEDKEYKEEKQAYQEIKDRMDIEIKNNSPNQTNFNGKRKLFSRSNKKFRASKKRKFSYRKPLRISTNDQISAVPLEEKEVPFLEKDLFIEEDLEEDYAEFSNFSSSEPIQFQMVESLEKTLKENFKFSSFRPGQRECIQNIVKKISTLLILPTGSGKSLCYQFPALLAPQNSIVLIISPLLSLVQDQIRTLPLCLTGAFLSSQQSMQERKRIIEDLRKGIIKILFISPEKLITDRFINLVKTLPPIAFACVDEAHCISEWSHNFRTSYLRVNAILREKLKVETILALTATATKRTEEEICLRLQIQNQAVIRISSLRSNLHATISCDEDKNKALIELLKSPHFASATSIIIYCLFQQQAEKLAHDLQIHQFDAASYHAGLPIKERQKIQTLFTENKLKIVVATVAFGMGIDKRDVNGVIHYNSPRSLENYVQEIGRAGRDGRESYCHLFLNNEDLATLRSFAFSDSVDDYTIKKLLEIIYPKTNSKAYSPKVQVVPITKTELLLDIKKEVISTILSYLELYGYLELLPTCLITCSLQLLKSQMDILAGQSKLFKWILDYSKKTKGIFEFDLFEAAKKLETELDNIQQELFSFQHEKKEIRYELKDDAYCFRFLKNQDFDIHELASQLMKHLNILEQSKLHKLNSVESAFKKVAYSHLHEIKETKEREQLLQEQIDQYFTGKLVLELEEENKTIEDPFLRADIKVFLNKFGEDIPNGRTLARIFHGIPSPAYPLTHWSRNSFWGRYRHLDFIKLSEIAREEILLFKTKDLN